MAELFVSDIKVNIFQESFSSKIDNKSSDVNVKLFFLITLSKSYSE